MALFEISNEQLKKINKLLEEKRSKQLYASWKAMQLPYMPLQAEEAITWIRKKIVESKRYGLESDKQTEEYILLFLREAVLHDPNNKEKIESIMTWPEREPDSKLDYLKLAIKTNTWP